MEVITSEKLARLSGEQTRKFQGLLPELIKRLIIDSVPNLTTIRIPDNDDIWAPGFDGIIECTDGSKYVNSGKSVWEFGSSSDSLKKINSDYNKRTNNSLGIKKKETTYYAVIPKIWAFNNQGCSISDWEADKKDWKEVRAYDASVLCEWINQSPVVAAWLYEELFEDDRLEFSTVDQAWEQFSSSTAPALSQGMFINGRGTEIQKFLDSIKEKRIVKVKSKTSMDSYGFCLSSFMLSDEWKNSVIVVHDINTYKRISEICKNKYILLKPIDIESFRYENTTIMCYSTEAVSIEPDIQLAPMRKKEFVAALKDMKIDECDIDNLYYDTHGELFALIRKIPGSSNFCKPKWSSNNDIKMLFPLIFMRNIDINNEADKHICERLCKKEFGSILSVYDEFLKMDDSPIKKTENIYSIVSSEETWKVLSPSINGEEIKRLTDTYMFVIDICCGDKTDAYQIKHRAKNYIYNFALSYLYYSYYFFDDRTLKEHIKCIVDRAWESMELISVLHIFAEAEPEMIMDILENDYSAHNSAILVIFSDVGYGSQYTDILRALDVLALNSSTKIRACNLLFKMCKIKADYYWNSTPKESLLNALWLRSNEGSLTIGEKKKLALKYLSDDEVGIDFVFSLLTKDSAIRGVRIGSRKKPTQSITYKEYFDAVKELFLAFELNILEKRNVGLVVNTIKHFHHFPIDVFNSFLDEVSEKDFDLIDRIKISYAAKMIVYNYRRYEGPDYSEYTKLLSSFITKTDEKKWDEDKLYLFYGNYNNCPMINLLNTNDENTYEEENRYILKHRIDTLNRLCSQKGSDMIVVLMQIMSDELNWGYTIGESDYKLSYNNVVERAVETNKYLLLSGFLDKIDSTTAYDQIKILSVDKQKTILSNIQNRDIVLLLENDDLKYSYWSNKTMHTNNEKEFEEFLKYNPFGLLAYYTVINHRDMYANRQIIMDILSAIIVFKHKNKKLNQMDKELINRFITEMDKNSYYSDDYAIKCLKLSKRNSSNRIHECIKKYYFYNPNEICKIINDRSDGYFKCFEFELEYELPNCAFEDYDMIKSFIHYIIDNTYGEKRDSAYSLIGELLSRALDKGITKKNIIIFKIADNYNNQSFDCGFEIGYDSLDRVRFVGDGTDQKAKYDELVRIAEKIEIDYPHAAQLLKRISKQYLYNSQRDHISSELGLEVF